ncbi:MAG TPA: hypothetical protein VGI20_15615 [Rhizomicrobium sp.]
MDVFVVAYDHPASEKMPSYPCFRLSLYKMMHSKIAAQRRAQVLRQRVEHGDEIRAFPVSFPAPGKSVLVVLEEIPFGRRYAGVRTEGDPIAREFNVSDAKEQIGRDPDEKRFRGIEWNQGPSGRSVSQRDILDDSAEGAKLAQHAIPLAGDRRGIMAVRARHSGHPEIRRGSCLRARFLSNRRPTRLPLCSHARLFPPVIVYRSVPR